MFVGSHHLLMAVKILTFWVIILKERLHSEDKCLDERMGLEWIVGRLADGGGYEVDAVGIG
jgi:hypothetical protein